MATNNLGALAIKEEPKDWRRRALARKDVTPKMRAVIEDMVWLALSRKDAAAKHEVNDVTVRKWLSSPPVMQYYTMQCDQLRRGERHKNLHRAVVIRDTSMSDKASLEAIKVLETDFDMKNKMGDGLNITLNIQPGYIADVSPHSDRAREILALSKRVPKVIEHDENE